MLSAPRFDISLPDAGFSPENAIQQWFARAERWRGCGTIRAAFDNWATTDDVLALQQTLADAVAALAAPDTGSV